MLTTNTVLLVPKFIPLEICKFVTHTLLLKHAQHDIPGDPQVAGSIAIGRGEPVCETLLEMAWPEMERMVGEPLIPTYSYARVYANGNELKKHTDRPSCEVSMTIQLGRSHHYSWPIYMGNQRIDLGEGDAVIYPGMDVVHWRDKCDGPPDYYSGQVFLHFVKANGVHKEWAGDKRWPKLPFVKDRTNLMGTK